MERKMYKKLIFHKTIKCVSEVKIENGNDVRTKISSEMDISVREPEFVNIEDWFGVYSQFIIVTCAFLGLQILKPQNFIMK